MEQLNEKSENKEDVILKLESNSSGDTKYSNNDYEETVLGPFL